MELNEISQLEKTERIGWNTPTFGDELAEEKLAGKIWHRRKGLGVLSHILSSGNRVLFFSRLTSFHIFKGKYLFTLPPPCFRPFQWLFS